MRHMATRSCGALLALLLAQSAACGCSDDAAPALQPCDPLDTLVIEYLAERQDGSLLLVVRPDTDRLEYEDMRLFYGPTQNMLERPIDVFRDAGRRDNRAHADRVADFGTWVAPSRSRARHSDAGSSCSDVSG
jgi:hypothetical protein